jgi:thermitase
MKPHVSVRLRTARPLRAFPHWSEILASKQAAPETIEPALDTLLHGAGLSFWATREYQPAAAEWSEDERASGLDRVYRLVLQRYGTLPPSLVEQIRLVPAVEEAHVGAVGSALLPELAAVQMSTQTDEASRSAIFLQRARRFSEGDASITVAVLDTGVDLTHPELRDALLPGYDFVDIIDGADDFIGDTIGADGIPADEVGHGTHVAGIVAARGLRMPAGVAPRCRILPVRVLAAFKQGGRRVGAGLVENINAGVKWAVDQGADVINMSLGVRHAGGGLPHEEVVRYARRRGASIVAATGNDGREELYYPGALPGVIAVGAFDRTGSVSSFSTFGRQVSLVAPGEEIYSTYLGNDYAFSTGTSHAAPFVAGVIALMKSYAHQHGHRLTDAQAKHVLKHTADRVDHQFRHPRAGFGRLNAGDAMRLLQARLATARAGSLN